MVVVVLLLLVDVVLVVGGAQGPFGVAITFPGRVRGLSVTTQISVAPGSNIIASCNCVSQLVIIIATAVLPVLSNENCSQGGNVEVVVVVITQQTSNVLFILVILLC